MQRRHGGDAEVHVLPTHRELDAAVLRHAPLRDVQPRHDLYARGDRGGKLAQRRLRFLQHAVVAVAHAQPVLERFDMDIGRLRLDRTRDQQVHQADHRGLAGKVLQALGVVLQRRIEAGVARCLIGLRIQAVQCGFQFDRHGDFQPHLPFGRHRSRRRSERIERVGRGQHQRIAIGGERNRPRMAQEPAVQPVRQHRLGRGVPIGRRNGNPEQSCIRVGEAALGHQAKLDQHRIQPMS